MTELVALYDRLNKALRAKTLQAGGEGREVATIAMLQATKQNADACGRCGRFFACDDHQFSRKFENCNNNR
jgi:hypothetical protein